MPDECDKEFEEVLSRVDEVFVWLGLEGGS